MREADDASLGHAYALWAMPPHHALRTVGKLSGDLVSV